MTSTETKKLINVDAKPSMQNSQKSDIINFKQKDSSTSKRSTGQVLPVGVSSGF
jgi:hypothetical protein